MVATPMTAVAMAADPPFWPETAFMVFTHEARHPGAVAACWGWGASANGGCAR
jgi:hypothetical protein